MEIILIVLAVVFLFAGFLKNNDSTSVNSKEISTKKTNQELLDELNNLDFEDQKQPIKTIYPKINEEKTQPTTIVNNYYVQNNVYIEKTSKANSYNELSDHSEKVWKRLGYKIKRGEAYAYKHYGNKIFTPNQVEKIGQYEIRYSESGLAKKLLQNTGSRFLAKDILVDKYGLTESEAEKLVKFSDKKAISHKRKHYNTDNYVDPCMSEWMKQANMSRGWD